MTQKSIPDGAATPGLKKGGLYAGLAAFAFGCLSLYLFVRLGLDEALGDGAFIAVVALPLIGYALVAYSERVTEVSAGGVAVKFAEFAKAEVDVRPSSADDEADSETIQIVEKSSTEALRKRREKLAPRDKVAFTLRFGRGTYYSERAINDYLNTLLAHDADMPVIFIDEEGRFVASTMGFKLRDALTAARDGPASNAFLEAIGSKKPVGLARLKMIVAVTESTVEPGTTNAQVLNEMLAEDVAVLVSVDADSKPVGVVRRDVIMAQMLATLASG